MHSNQQRTLFQGLSYAERVSSTLSSLPPPVHPPQPQRKRRWSQSFDDGLEENDREDDSGSDDNYIRSSEESTDSFEGPAHFSTSRELHSRIPMRVVDRSESTSVGLSKYYVYAEQPCGLLWICHMHLTNDRFEPIHSSLVHLLKEAHYLK